MNWIDRFLEWRGFVRQEKFVTLTGHYKGLMSHYSNLRGIITTRDRQIREITKGGSQVHILDRNGVSLKLLSRRVDRGLTIIKLDVEAK